MVLSSEKIIKDESTRRNINVKGILGIIQDLHSKSIIGKQTAIDKLKMLPKVNQRIPKSEIINLTKEFKQNLQSI